MYGAVTATLLNDGVLKAPRSLSSSVTLNLPPS